MSQTYTTPLTGTGANAFSLLIANSDTLRSSFSGTGTPGTPVTGQLWSDTTTATEAVLKHYDGDEWLEIGSRLHTHIELGTSAAPFQAKFMLLENRSAQITAAAAQVGRAYLFTTDSKARIVVSSSVREVVMSASNVDYTPINIPAAAWERDATNPPTAATKGTTPTCRGWLFDATNELASIAVRVPAGYGADVDLKLRLLCVLNQAETSGDDIDWTVDLVSILPASAEVVSGTSTAYTVAQDMGANVSDGAVHAVDVVLTYNDATNPIAAGDLLVLEIHRTNLTNCGGVIVVGAQLLVPFGTKITE